MFKCNRSTTLLSDSEHWPTAHCSLPIGSIAIDGREYNSAREVLEAIPLQIVIEKEITEK